MYASVSGLIEGAKTGRLVSFPTDTVPALATLPEHADLIFQAKGRSLAKPLILMGAELDDLLPYIQGNQREMALWQEVAARYWPGALTLVLPASDRLPRQVNPVDPSTIGLRVPNLDIARQILAATGPMATTSANKSGAEPLSTPDQIADQFPQALVLDEFLSYGSGLPSTVAKWDGKGWRILRQGGVQLGAAGDCKT